MIDELISQAQPDAVITIPSGWGQGRTVFGGLSAGLLCQAMQHQLAEERALRVFTVQFIGPLLLDKPFQLKVEVLRHGKNVTQMQARILQDNEICVQATAAFGSRRESMIHKLAEPVSSGPQPTAPVPLPDSPAIPRFHQYIDLKIDDGGLPFSGSSAMHYRGWMRFSEAPVQITDAHLIALVDVWPPATLQVLDAPAPASTLSWKIEFAYPRTDLKPQDWLCYQADTRLATDGYGHTEANIYAPNGELLAISRQVVTVFA